MIEHITLARVCVKLTLETAREWASALSAAAEEFDIGPSEHQAMWLAQLCHESSGFTRLSENLHYSAERLAQVWPHRYALDPRAVQLRPNATAHRIGGRPELVANDVYANRMGNGAPESGDGWKFRGRYPCMLTGRNNYTAAADAIGVPELADPDALLQDIPGMARVCAWFWHVNGIGRYAAAGDFDGVCDCWNRGHKTERVGDSIGYSDRLEWLRKWREAIEAQQGGGA